MTGISAARSSIGIFGDGNGATGARPSGVPGRIAATILGCAGLTSANRSIAKAFEGLIAALNVGTFMWWEPNGESRLMNGDSSSNHPDHTSRTPVQAMKYRHKSNPALFVETPNNILGCDR